MNAVELKLKRRNTLQFINAEPIRLSLNRPVTTRANNTRGGKTQLEPTTVAPQTFRILHQPPRRRRQENTPPNASFGEIPYAKDQLMGRWDMDVEAGDWFEWQGATYEVTYVFHDNTYEIIANLANTSQ